MTIEQKLATLSDGAKYDVSCASSGAEGTPSKGGIGATHKSGICHSFTSDGRCVSLLKVLLTNVCIYDCSYCINRASNDIKRAAFTPREIADLTINFYKRNYIEGLFLSSGIIKNVDHTMELLIKAVKILRHEYRFNGYVHLKLIPGASTQLIKEATILANRVSSNIELPSSHSLQLLAPDKSKQNVLGPLKVAKELSLERSNKPIGMSTQLIVGATPESDFDILRLSSALYKQALLKRVYYSAYIPVNNDKNLPVVGSMKPPLLREHRLYQADWLMRFYGFTYEEIVSESNRNMDERFDPKTFWALSHLQLFPIDINRASFEELIRIPGIGIRGAQKIVAARRFRTLSLDNIKQLKISIKKAKYFITAGGKYQKEVPLYADKLQLAIIREEKKIIQPTLFDYYGQTVLGEI